MQDWWRSPIIPSTSLAGSWLATLQNNGYRLTVARRAVVETLANSVHLLNPMEIYLQAVHSNPGLGLVTVYRTLDKLEELGLVQRVHMAGGCHSYIAAAEGHQHLLICTTCHRAEYFTGDDLSPLVARLGQSLGYSIRDHWLQLFGLCRDCQAENPNGIDHHER